MINKNEIRNSFSRSAGTYDRFVDIQQELADELSSYFSYIDPSSILELGCATGGYTMRLSCSFKYSSIISVDFSPEMVNMAKKKLETANNVQFICDDAEAFLQLTNQKFDFITSNATLHWCSDINSVFQNIRRVLHDDGSILFSIFGPGTLSELRYALTHIFNKQVTLPADSFLAFGHIKDSFEKLFRDCQTRKIVYTREYDDALQLLRHLKYTGVTAGKNLMNTTLTPGKLRALDSAFRDHFGKCRVSYETMIFYARK